MIYIVILRINIIKVIARGPGKNGLKSEPTEIGKAEFIKKRVTVRC